MHYICIEVLMVSLPIHKIMPEDAQEIQLYSWRVKV